MVRAIVEIFALYSPIIVPVLDMDESHPVYISFQCRDGWHCQFLEANLKTQLPRKLHFTSTAKVIELAHRGGGLPDLASRQALDEAIIKGRVGVFLNLTEEQYQKLIHW